MDLLIVFTFGSFHFFRLCAALSFTSVMLGLVQLRNDSAMESLLHVGANDGLIKSGTKRTVCDTVDLLWFLHWESVGYKLDMCVVGMDFIMNAVFSSWVMSGSLDGVTWDGGSLFFSLHSWCDFDVIIIRKYAEFWE